MRERLQVTSAVGLFILLFTLAVIITANRSSPL